MGDIKQFDESYLSTMNDKYSCEIRVIAPPEGKDPDEFIRSVGAESYMEYMKHLQDQIVKVAVIITVVDILK